MTTGENQLSQPGKKFLASISGDFNILCDNENLVYHALVSLGSGADGMNFSVSFVADVPEKGINISQLVKIADHDDKIDESSLPSFLKDIRINAFEIGYEESKATIRFNTTIEHLFAGKVTADLVYESFAQSQNTIKEFTGTLKLGDRHQFKVKIGKKTDGAKSADYVVAAYNHSGIEEINLKQSPQLIFRNTALQNLPDDLILKVEDPRVFFLYNSVSENNQTETGIFLGAGAKISTLQMHLEHLPLAGNISLSLEEMLVVYANKDFSGEEIFGLNTGDKQDEKWLPENALRTGFNPSVKIRANDKLIEYPAKEESTDEPATPKLPAMGVQPVQPDASGDTTKWFKVDRKLGPLDLRRVGFRFNISSGVVFLLDAGINLSMIDLQVLGLGFGFRLKWPPDTPAFYLSGLGISFHKDPIEISGIFLKTSSDDNPNKLEFYGAVRISLSRFSITGIGAYSQEKSIDQVTGETKVTKSFFIYAGYFGPLGGPAFFFITGIALGFGYNRRIRPPKIEEVRDFPLVRIAFNSEKDKNLLSVVTDLVDGKWIPESPGDNWLALGIRFTSFKIIDSFVLAIVQFQTETEFMIIGLSVLAWPDIKSPIAYVELALLVSFRTGGEVIAVSAMITANSYIFDKNCRLSGGFAFYIWISGENEGDFVITLGGYHPKYQVPAHYPKVDRLALDWKISNTVVIHGDLYFALTPKEIMAGGHWLVAFNLSFLSASCEIWADMYIAWAPFHYMLDAGVIVRIAATIKVLFVHVHFKLQIGCVVHIWGPPFSGNIHVDWTVFSFTIPFGSSAKKTPVPLKWEKTGDQEPAGFLDAFVPLKDNKSHPVDIRLISGMLREIKDKAGNTLQVVVNPYELVIGIDSFFPLTDFETGNLNLPDKEQCLIRFAGQDNPENLYVNNQPGFNKDFGIKPMGKTSAITHLVLNIERSDGDKYETITEKIVLTGTGKGVAGALWSNGSDNQSVIKKVLSGIEVHTTEEDNDIVYCTDGFCECKMPEVEIGYFVNSGNGSYATSPAISKTIAETKLPDIIGALNNAGFNLPEPDKDLKPDFLRKNCSLFFVSIGENIPDIINV